MPTYDYECTQCGHVFEMYQPITAKAKRKPDEPCAKCGKVAPIRRLIGGGGAVIFKGSGFYETDYRSESYKQGAKAESESKKPKTEAVAEKSSDQSGAKPAGKPETAPKKSKGGSAAESPARPAKTGA